MPEYPWPIPHGNCLDMSKNILSLAFLAALAHHIKKGGHGAQSAIARAADITPSYLNDIVKSRAQGSEETRRKIAQAVGMDYEDMLTQGRRLLKMPESGGGNGQDDHEFTKVPKVRARLSAGGGSFETGEDIIGYYAFRTDFLREYGPPKNMVLFDVSGDSMEPLICHGDTVLVDGSQVDIVAGNIYAIAIGQEVIVKRVDKTIDGIKLISENREKYSPQLVEINDHSTHVQILGRVVWLGRRF